MAYAYASCQGRARGETDTPKCRAAHMQMYAETYTYIHRETFVHICIDHASPETRRHIDIDAAI